MTFKWPLMKSQFHDDDFEAIHRLLSKPNRSNFDGGDWNHEVRLTQGSQVKAFEEEFAEWNGSKHAVFVTSGSSANLLTMAAFRQRELFQYGNKVEPYGNFKILVPCVTWASDITSVLHAGFEPVFIDIDRRTLGMDCDAALRRVDKPAAVFVTHCMGYNAFDGRKLFVPALKAEGVTLLEDCCEGPGATHTFGNKVGTFGLASNFSFYYAHHMTTIEGGMVCTDDEQFAGIVRCLRGHGLRREMYGPGSDVPTDDCLDLEPQFVFQLEGYNCRSTEINAAIGRSQLKRLDEGIELRREKLKLFLSLLDPDLYQTDFAVEGSSPYALTLVLGNHDDNLRERVGSLLQELGVETRRGIAGGGNQLRQPYLRRRYGTMYAEFPNAEHVHWNGFAIGLWPSLEDVEIKWLCEKLNGLKQ